MTHNLHRLWLLLGTASLLLLASSGTYQAQDKVAQKHDAKALADALRDVINTGAEIFNKQGDHAGCYRLYQGALLSVKPFLAPDLKNTIDEAIKDAERLPRISDRAFRLRKTLDDIREQARSAPAKIDDKDTKKEEPKKVDDKKVDDKKKEDKKIEDKKKDEPKKVDDKKKVEDKKKVDDKKVEDKKPEEKKADKSAGTLWERLGGDKGTLRVVDDFLGTAALDPAVNMTRGGKFPLDPKTAALLKQELVRFISNATGGPFKYTGKSMKEAHKGMYITDAEYMAAGDHLKKALEKNNVAAEAVTEVMKAIASLRDDIVEGPAPQVVDTKKKDSKTKDDKKSAPKKPVDKPKDAKSATAPVEAEGQVAGTVTFEGKAAPSGFVTLVGGDQRRFSTSIRAEGNYHFKTKIPVGDYRIAIERIPDDTTKDILPAKYRNEATSGLSLRVQAGAQTSNFELKGASVAPSKPVALSKEEAGQGFVSIFDGKTLKGWKSSNGYVVENGLLICEKKGSGNMMTEKEFGDFIFRFEFKFEPGGNNGVNVRGHEIQILDDYAPIHKNIKPCQYHGSIYCKVPAKKGHTKPAGEWNTQEIAVEGTRWKVTVNDVLIVDADIAKVEGLEAVAKRTKSPLGFMGHGTRIEFRNLRVKELSSGS